MVAEIFAIVSPIMVAVVAGTWRISWKLGQQDAILGDLCARMVKVERALDARAEFERRRR